MAEQSVSGESRGPSIPLESIHVVQSALLPLRNEHEDEIAEASTSGARTEEPSRRKRDEEASIESAFGPQQEDDEDREAVQQEWTTEPESLLRILRRILKPLDLWAGPDVILETTLVNGFPHTAAFIESDPDSVADIYKRFEGLNT